MKISRYALVAALLVPAMADAQESRTHTPRPTVPAITEGDLRTRVYIFADDSMGGREPGTAGHTKSTAYIAAELQRLGLQPAGDNGTFFQAVPLVTRSASRESELRIGTRALATWDEYVPLDSRRRARPFADLPVVFAGTLGDTASMITREQAQGHVLVFAMRPGSGNLGAPLMRPGERFGGATGAIFLGPDALVRSYGDYFRQANTSVPAADTITTPSLFLLPLSASDALFGVPADSLSPGRVGARVSGRAVHEQHDAGARNVVAILPGSDPALRGQYVAIGAHSDHVGTSAESVDHDSLRASNAVLRPSGADMRPRQPTAEDAARIRAAIDSLRRVNPPRQDSIYNGADDDASGSMAALEIAEAFARGAQKPRRSLLFVWHTAEELGLVGARYYTENPTVPRDSIVAQLNMDMVGRGNPDDVPHSRAGSVQLLGSRRLSTELGELVEAVNARQSPPFELDYTFDQPGHPEQYYCRSDHYMYARFGIPVTFFSSGGHRDYHMLTDEPQYIHYGQLTAITKLVHDVAREIANRDARLVVDQPKPDPNGRCVQ